MTVAVIILSLLTLVGIGFGYFYLYEYVSSKYDFDVFKFGLLSILPPALVGLGFAVVSGREENYWQALSNIIGKPYQIETLMLFYLYSCRLRRLHGCLVFY